LLKGEAAAAPTPRAPKPTAPEYTPSADAETRMAAIKRDPAFYQVGTQKQQKLAHEMHDLLLGAPAVPRSGETENRAAIRVLNESGKLTSPDPAVRAAAMTELRKRLAAEATADEKDAIANAPVEALRDQFKVDHSKVLAPIRGRWDAEEEAQLLATFSQRGVQPAAVTEIASWYQAVFNGALGLVGNIDATAVEAEFRALATKHGIEADVVNAIVEHHKSRLGAR
jgi:hypothetical protein